MIKAVRKDTYRFTLGEGDHHVVTFDGKGAFINGEYFNDSKSVITKLASLLDESENKKSQEVELDDSRVSDYDSEGSSGDSEDVDNHVDGAHAVVEEVSEEFGSDSSHG